MRHRHHARRDGRRGAAAGAARTVLQVPGIARRAVDHRLRRRVQTELRRVGAPEDYQPGALVTLDDGKIMVGDEAVIEMRPVPHPRAGVPGVDILQQERHARQRTLRQSRLQSLPRLIVHFLHDGIQPGIQRFDPLDRSFQNVAAETFFRAINSARPRASYVSYSGNTVMRRVSGNSQ